MINTDQDGMLSRNEVAARKVKARRSLAPSQSSFPDTLYRLPRCEAADAPASQEETRARVHQAIVRRLIHVVPSHRERAR